MNIGKKLKMGMASLLVGVSLASPLAASGIENNLLPNGIYNSVYQGFMEGQSILSAPPRPPLHVFKPELGRNDDMEGIEMIMGLACSCCAVGAMAATFAAFGIGYAMSRYSSKKDNLNNRGK